jgi:hypothetical protein
LGDEVIAPLGPFRNNRGGDRNNSTCIIARVFKKISQAAPVSLKHPQKSIGIDFTTTLVRFEIYLMKVGKKRIMPEHLSLVVRANAQNC